MADEKVVDTGTMQAKVLMVKSKLSTLWKNKEGDKLCIAFSLYDKAGGEMVHFHFISNERPKEGDVMMFNEFSDPCKCIKSDGVSVWNSTSMYDAAGTLKVVASTNRSLGVPYIPLEWIAEKYVPSNGSITSVKLKCFPWQSVNQDSGIVESSNRLQLTEDNNVIIVDENEIHATSGYYSREKIEGDDIMGVYHLDDSAHPNLNLSERTLSDDMSTYEKINRVISQEDVRTIAKREFDDYTSQMSERDSGYKEMAWHWWKRAFDVAARIFEKQQSETSIEFVEWCAKEGYIICNPVTLRWYGHGDFFTTKQLFELWKNKNK